MTFASFILASALGAGAEAPVVVRTGHAAPTADCCTAPAPAADCGCPSDCCEPAPAKPSKSLFGGLFSKKSKPAPAADCGCEPAPAPCAAPAPCEAPAPCDPCATPAPTKHSKPSFFGGLFGGKKKSAPAPAEDCGCPSGCDTAAPGVIPSAAPVVVTPAPAVITPAPAVIMPAPASPTVIMPAPAAPTALPAAPAPVYHGSPAPVATPAPLPTTVTPAATPAVPIKKLPAVEKKIGATPVVPAIGPAAAKGETGSSNPFDSDRRHVSRYTRASDFSSLTGQLTYVHADGGLWVLRYASVATEDAHGGSVILARDSRLSNYREGDLVTVQGQIVDNKGSSKLGAPLFQATTISLVERPAR